MSVFSNSTSNGDTFLLPVVISSVDGPIYKFSGSIIDLNWLIIACEKWISCVFTPTSGKQVGKSKKLWNNFHLGWFVFYEKPLKNFILYHLNHSQNYHGRQQRLCFVNKMYQKGWLWTRKSSRNLNPSYSFLNILTI